MLDVFRQNLNKDVFLISGMKPAFGLCWTMTSSLTIETSEIKYTLQQQTWTSECMSVVCSVIHTV